MSACLLDTHVLLWAAGVSDRLPSSMRDRLANPAEEVVYSVASLWEIVIKRTLGRPDFRVEPRTLRKGLLATGYRELQVRGDHVLALDLLPPIHRDPFDRMLLAQAHVEGLTLVTADGLLARYPGPIERI